MSAATPQLLTFLFTDMESSSAHWEADPTAMRSALEMHDQLVGEIIPESGGEVVKHLGDGICAVFGLPAAAIAGATRLMLALQQQDFGALDGPLIVRMGLHTGEAVERDGDYFGRSVNRAARVMDAANGNQIVVSQVTASLCPDLTFDDQGSHQLKGVGVERLLILRADELVVDGRPLRVCRPSNLPVETNAFVGRSGLASDLAERLQATRSLTLVGPGGVGKTRLVLHVAEHLAEAHRDGTWFCNLAKSTEPGSVVPAVAEIIGAPPLPGSSTAESIGQHLGRRRALVVLDNCEHAVSDARTIAEEILTRAPNCLVVATSREPLGLTGEQLFPVMPLDPTSEAVDLLVERARERDPGFVLDERDEPAARQICERLDGLPLAIELAAARLAILSPEAVAKRLADRFRLLRGNRAGERHAALRSTIQWSYDLLRPIERELFDRLSVFRGGFTLESATAVCADELDEYEILDILGNLVDKSVVQRDPDPTRDRFVLLESLREFGREQLEQAGLAESTLARHVEWFAEVSKREAVRLYTADEAAAWHVLLAEWDNLRIAVRRALDQGDLDRAADIIESVHYLSVIAMRFEGMSWSELWLAHAGSSGHHRYARIRAVASSAAYYAMDLDRTRDLALAGLDAPDLDFRAMPFVAIWALLALGDADDAQRFVDAWLEAERAGGIRPFDEAMVAAAAAVLHGAMRRDRETAEVYIERLDGIAQSVGAPSAAAYAYMVRGIALARLDPDHALDALLAAEAESRKLGDRHAFIDGAQTAAAQIIATDEDLAQTLHRCAIALESASHHEFLPRIAHDLQSAAIALARAGDATTGARLLGASRAMGQRSWDQADRLLRSELADDFDRLVEEGTESSLEAAADVAIGAVRRAKVRVADAEQA